MEYETSASGGEKRVVEVKAGETTWEGRNALCVAVRDITERKEAEKKLADALSDLKFALASEKVLLDELDKKNKELIELSITDGLTGLYNHRFIQERLNSNSSGSSATAGPCRA